MSVGALVVISLVLAVVAANLTQDSPAGLARRAIIRIFRARARRRDARRGES